MRLETVICPGVEFLYGFWMYRVWAGVDGWCYMAEVVRLDMVEVVRFRFLVVLGAPEV